MIITKDKKGQKSKINRKSERTRKKENLDYTMYSKVIEGKGGNIYILLRRAQTKSRGSSQLILIPKLNGPTLNQATGVQHQNYQISEFNFLTGQSVKTIPLEVDGSPTRDAYVSSTQVCVFFHFILNKSY